MEADRVRACALYFKGNAGFDRTMKALWEKWRSYGRLAGEISLPDPAEEEIKALEGFFGESVCKKGKLRFQARAFEQALENTRFQQLSLREILEEYYGRPLFSKKEEEAELQARKEAFFFKARETAVRQHSQMKKESLQYIASAETGSEKEALQSGSACLRWLEALSSQKLWQLCQMVGNEDACLELVLKIENALYRLEKLDPQKGVRLAVLAMECTGDPHGFDRGTTAGNLLLGVLPVLLPDNEYRIELSPRIDAEDALDRYIRCGIRPDDLSSFTILYRILLKDEQGTVPAYEAMADRREPVLVSLLNMRNIQSAIPLNRKVYVVENQMVFSQLCEDCPEASLICTSGQVRTASLMLLDLLCREDVIIYYSGDLDPEGICIADRLILRGKDKIKPWHMTVRDYEESLSNVSLTESRLCKLESIQSDSLKEAAEAVKTKGMAGYQESLLKKMTEEIRTG